MALQPAITSNDAILRTATVEEVVGHLRPLQALNEADSFALALWHYHDSIPFEHAQPSDDDYLQAAGRAKRMTLELRTSEAGGEPTQWVLAPSPVTDLQWADVGWQGAVYEVSGDEVWTAEQAAPVFEEYSRTRTIPEWVHRRQIHI